MSILSIHVLLNSANITQYSPNKKPWTVLLYIVCYTSCTCSGLVSFIRLYGHYKNWSLNSLSTLTEDTVWVPISLFPGVMIPDIPVQNWSFSPCHESGHVWPVQDWSPSPWWPLYTLPMTFMGNPIYNPNKTTSLSRRGNDSIQSSGFVSFSLIASKS